MTRSAWRLLERWLGRRLPADRVAPIVGDLASDYARCRQSRGAVRAGWWLLRETASLTVAYRRGRAAKRGPMDRLRSDLVHAWRTMRARPTATLATVGVLSLGIGLVSAMFALADPYVTKPLPFAQADRLVTMSIRTRATSGLPTLETFRSRTDLFARVTATDNTEDVYAGSDGSITLHLLPVAADYFQVLGAAVPRLDDWHRRRGSLETPVILSASAARRLRDLAPVAGVLRATDESGTPNGQGYRVRPPLPASFLFPSGSQYWDGVVPLDDHAELAAVERSPAGLTVTRVRLSLIARLQADVTAEHVATVLTTASSDQVLPTRGYAVSALPVVDTMTKRLRPLATGALAAGLLVLIVCAANVANLLIARGAFRRRELATREALGASGGDLARLVLVELGLLTLIGVGGGLAIATGVLAAGSLVIPAQYTALGAPAISARVVGFALLAGGVVMLAGLVPALAAWRVAPSVLFNQAATAEARGVRVTRFSMTAAQTALAVVLLVGATLMARSYVNLLSQDPGYTGDLFAIGVRYPAMADGASWRSAVETTIARLGHLDGVSKASAIKGPLVENIGYGMAGPAVTVDGQRAWLILKQVETGFFQTAGTRVLEGRALTPADERRGAVVNETFVREHSADRSPVGRRIEWSILGSAQSLEVVGEVQNVTEGALDQPPIPTVYYPLDDTTPAGTWTTFVMRADRPGPLLAAAAEREIQAVVPKARVASSGMMRDRLMRSVQDRSFATLMVALFGVAAIGVSAAGLVGVVGFVVARRTREIAIRLAIGAARADVWRLVTREAALASGLGAVVGLVAGGWLSKTMTSLLFGLAPADPASMVLAAVVLVLVVGVAAWVPARRALGLSPSEALRVE